MPKPKPLRLVLDDALKSLGLDVPLKGYSLWRVWRKIVGETVASNAQPMAIRNHILFVGVSHPTWMQQLQFLKDTLLEKLNRFLGEPLIKDIRFRLETIPSPPPLSEKECRWEEGKLSSETVNRIETLLGTIRDTETRRTLRDLMIKGAKLEEFRRGA